MINTPFTRAIAAALIGLASVSAHAADTAVTDANYPGPMSLQSNLTRAQVRAELARAKAAGQVYDGEQYPGPQSLASNRSASDVRAEVLKEKAQGLAFNDATYPVPARNLPSKKAQQQYSNLASAGRGPLVR